jgi:hypothetical protein
VIRNLGCEQPVATALLVVRAWSEGQGPAGFRARLSQTTDVVAAPPRTVVVTSVEQLTALVEAWLAALTPPTTPR